MSLNCSDSGCQVVLLVADAPQRAKDLKFAGHQAYYGCELCTSKADPLILDGRVVKSKRVWRPNSANGPRRAREETLKLADRAQGIQDIAELPCRNYGVKGRSHLFDLREFDPMCQVQPEMMHMGFLGIVKLLTLLTFGLGKARPSSSATPRIKPEMLSRKLLKIKVPCEFNNATRPLEIGYKAEEWRNLILFFFPVVTSCFKEEGTRERRIWETTAFLMRAVSLSQEEFQKLSPSYFQEQLSKWYVAWSSTFGDYNLTYNVHMVKNLMHSYFHAHFIAHLLFSVWITLD